MSNIFPSYVVAQPSYMMPELIMQYQQASGAFDLLAGYDPMVRLSDNSLYVYARAIDVRTKIAAGQHAYNQLPSVTIKPKLLSTPTYLQRVRAEYDHHDVSAGAVWGVSVPEAQRLGMRQAHFQQLRSALLYGYNPANGEGLLNTQGATTVNLPPDSNGNTTIATYDNGQLAIFFLSIISALKTRTLQLGQPTRVSICGPQRDLGAMEYQNIVQVTQFQRAGAGSQTTKGVVEAILAMNGDTLEWNYDDTLIGKGAGGTDAIVITLPEVKKPPERRINTNEFANLSPGLLSCNVQLVDMAAPREIPTPLPGGAIDVLAEMRVTSGWGLRPEALTILSATSGY